MFSSLRSVTVVAILIVLYTLSAYGVSIEERQVFMGKLDEIRQNAERKQGSDPAPAPVRTSVTEGELNSWLSFEGAALLPGLSDPVVSLLPDGRVLGMGTIDLETFVSSASPRRTDLLSLLRGQVPVEVSGNVVTAGGEGRFELERATIAGLEVPEVLLQDLLSRYTRTPEWPDGVRLGEPFPLPAGIDHIVVAQDRAVVFQ
jgi:hypothetical protein